jgi:AcrR family transcriptional regulator
VLVGDLNDWEQINRDTLDEGRRQLAEHGAAALSLRSVARELGMVSSAVYELFNQTRGVVEHHADLFDAAALRMAAVIGLRS